MLLARTFFAVSLVTLLACTADPPVRRYQARGQVKDLSGSGAELSVAIQHEHIAEFEDRDGKRSEMPAMTMEFGVADSVPRALWKQGQKLAFAFDVRWDKRPTLFIVQAEPLPETTALQLSADKH